MATPRPSAPRSRSRNAPRPTWTALVFDALCAAGDFLSEGQLRAATGASVNQLSAALWALHHTYCAVDCAEGPGGERHWFATPETARRTRRTDERRPDDPGTRRRGRRAAAQLRLPPPAASQ